MIRPFATLIGRVVTLLAFFAVCGSASADVQKQAAGYLEQIGVSRGICVLLDPNPLELAQALAAQSELIVYVHLLESDQVDDARRSLDQAGLLGTRVYLELWVKIRKKWRQDERELRRLGYSLPD